MDQIGSCYVLAKRLGDGGSAVHGVTFDAIVAETWNAATEKWDGSSTWTEVFCFDGHDYFEKNPALPLDK